MQLRLSFVYLKSAHKSSYSTNNMYIIGSIGWISKTQLLSNSRAYSLKPTLSRIKNNNSMVLPFQSDKKCYIWYQFQAHISRFSKETLKNQFFLTNTGCSSSKCTTTFHQHSSSSSTCSATYIFKFIQR